MAKKYYIQTEAAVITSTSPPLLYNGSEAVTAEGETVDLAGESSCIISGGAHTNLTSAKFYHPDSTHEAAGEDTATAGVSLVVPFAGTVRNLYIFGQTAADVGGVTVTLYKNGSATTLTATILEAATAGNDTTHTFTVAAGGRISLSYDAGSSESIGELGWGFEIVKS